jgi:hypothetical protein
MEQSESVLDALVQSTMVMLEHSSMSPHSRTPSPKWPDGHWHVNDPGIFKHGALDRQLWMPSVHSSMLSQTTPLPVHPALQEHKNEPAVSVHDAFG